MDRCTHGLEAFIQTTDYYVPEYERSIIWNDSAIAIGRLIQVAPTLSGKDQQAKLLALAEHYA